MTNEPVCETETDLQTDRADVWLPRRRDGRGGMDWEAGIRRCKLLRREWISRVLLYSTGNWSQYPEINYTGKEYEKQYIYYIYMHYMYILHNALYICKRNHFAVQQKLTEHCASTMLQ